MAGLKNANAALAGELNKQKIETRTDKNINFFTRLRFNGVLILVGARPTILESQIMQLEGQDSKLLELFNGTSLDENKRRKFQAQTRDNYTTALGRLEQQETSGTRGTNPGGMFSFGAMGDLP